MKRILKQFVLLALIAISYSSKAQKTEIQFLSGTDKDNTVAWDFMCTAGRNSGKWTKIPVPSNWEFQGFGNYTYGSEREDSTEAGMYRHAFKVPSTWSAKEVFIVFDGSMTDTEVKINGQLAGPVHQGAFYRFRYNITPLLKQDGENVLEVKVNKVSANGLVNEAERKADYWVFGGIFRPVFLEAYPKEHLERIAVDAKGHGSISINVFPINLKGAATIVAQVKTKDGKPFGPPFTTTVKQGDSIVRLQSKFSNVKLWSTEFPNLYKVDVTLKKGTSTVHSLTETIGFRTVELRRHDGFYVNGKKIRFKGVNRGSFWPTSGRTTSRALSLQDASLIKDMNMNAVRMSHYPPDDHFLEVCDSIGLFVIDELAGWQYPPYNTEAGRRLVKELILKDINHPSIVLWANGNEGGFNFDLVPDYAKHDIQQRPVIHPWINSNGMNTKHYIPWNYGINTFFQGKDVFFPTEFLHGLYDGGHGAGLDDFWNLMLSNPLSAGGFLWDFCDQGAVRTDRNGQLDTKGNAAADGILGPYREKEGSFFTIKEIWSPVYFPRQILTKEFDGRLPIENRYYFTNLDQCKFSWRLKKMTGLDGGDTASVIGPVPAPNIAPQTAGTLAVALPNGWQNYDVLYITAKDMYGRELHTWSWPVTTPEKMAKRLLPNNTGTINVSEEGGMLQMKAASVEVSIDLKTGLLSGAKNSKGTISLTNGPVLINDTTATTATVRHYDTLGTHVVRVTYNGRKRYQFTWTMQPSGVLGLRFQYRPEANEEMLGVSFNYPEDAVQGIQLIADGPYHVYKNRMKGTTFNSWSKTYNNTVTGESWNYPEFKGYYSNFYAGKLQTKEGPFSVYTETENLFLHLLNPAVPKGLGRASSMAAYPKAGGISFMHGITAIGTKSQKREDLGPQSQNNVTFANGNHDMQVGVLYFDFR
ncbi:MAG TPA: glycoside hydrolase family 2 TIM barrel-domain containing protein [Flavisolibacter sp.]|nr:glycoside hydrolase family 2 TIM barrel-domain containing protein [Flavisolibacter sp.]